MESATSKVLQGNIPHILEIILLKLDYEAFKTCFEVCKDWREILKSESFQKRAKALFAAEITMDQAKLTNACREGDIEKINGLLSTDLLNINLRVNQDSPLIVAAYAGKVNAVKLLLERGADPNIVDEDRDTALHNCIIDDVNQGHINCVHVLLDSGADPNLTNDNGDTPISLALSEISFARLRPFDLYLAFITALLDAGAKLTDEDKKEMNELPSALARQFYELKKRKKEAEKQEEKLISALELMGSISYYILYDI